MLDRWDESEDDSGRCLFPGKCLMPGDHLTSECHTAEMMEDLIPANDSTQPDIPEDLRASYDACAELIHSEIFSGLAERLRGVIERCARLESSLAQVTATMDRFVTEAEAVMDGELGHDWADHYGPLWERLQAAKDALLCQRERSK